VYSIGVGTFQAPVVVVLPGRDSVPVIPGRYAVPGLGTVDTGIDGHCVDAGIAGIEAHAAIEVVTICTERVIGSPIEPHQFVGGSRSALNYSCEVNHHIRHQYITVSIRINGVLAAQSTSRKQDEDKDQLQCNDMFHNV
jgi:hypothetical protein